GGSGSGLLACRRRRFRLTGTDFLRLTADADDERFEVRILARQLAVDRVRRNDEEVARVGDDAFALARTELDRHGSSEDVNVGVVRGVMVPTAQVPGLILDPAGPADPTAVEIVEVLSFRTGRLRHRLVRVQDNGS